MLDGEEKRLFQQFRNFTRSAFHDNTVPFTQDPGRFFVRAEGDTNAIVERADLKDPIHQRRTVGRLESHWLAARFGTWLNRRYYLVAVRIEGDFWTQDITYRLYEYRFAGIGKFHRYPLSRERILPSLKASDVALRYDPTDPRKPYFDAAIDRGWTGHERRVSILHTLETFGRRLGF